MFWVKNTPAQWDAILAHLQDFEQFCMGEKHLTPEQFQDINIQLSLSAVEHIGKCRIEMMDDGRHLIWVGADGRAHDLGPADNPNVVRDYPGFHRTRSLSLGHDLVEENTLVNAPRRPGQITLVKLKDGISSVAPNYKLALRNAALKSHIRKCFNRSTMADLWGRFHGTA